MTKARGRRTYPFPSFPRRRETRYTGSQEEAKEAGGFRAECVSDGSFLRRRIQLFIAYLYKPEAQAKVFKMPVLHSHIIPSLALQACQTRDTVKSRFSNPPLIVDKGALGPFDKLRDRVSVRSVSLPNWPLLVALG